ncbi:vesicle-associated membrane protein 1 isoform X3 [Choloepus didactylus]|uniref:vesicle-associated membrane protein 1 isoform X3 n=1 Tax=Choloepus didactylus TaxID=27675 RepID=UPI00189EC21B|nr:vesicle-associated membrane protein 1 isoform X3 [Choloepus didactylus]
MSAPAEPPTPGAEGAALGGGAPGGDAPGGGSPGGGPPGPPPNKTSNRKLQQNQAEVAEVVDIIRVNLDKVLEREEKLLELDDRADALQAGASIFESYAAKLKRKYWWKNCKMMIMLGAVCAIIVILIVSLENKHGLTEKLQGLSLPSPKQPRLRCMAGQAYHPHKKNFPKYLNRFFKG